MGVSLTGIFTTISTLLINQLLSATLPTLPYQYDNNIQLKNVYDFVVVGAGTGGCVVAGRLSETGARVLLLEAGPNQSPTTVIPSMSILAVNTRRDWHVKSIPQKQSNFAYNDNTPIMTAGRMMGGGTSINGLVWTRGNKIDYDHWAKLGNPGWDYDSVLPYFKKSEDYHGLRTAYTDQFRGQGGPIRIETSTVLVDLLKTVSKAAFELGFNLIDETGPSQIGMSPLHSNIKNGLRVTTSEAYVRPNIDRPNFDVLTEATVNKVVFNRRKEAVGVEFLHRKKVRTVKVNKEVILSAGTMFTPKLLMLSGIGPAKQLRQHGIPIVHALPGVGKNFQDHPSLQLPYKVREGTSMTIKQLLDVKEIMKYLKSQTGIFSKQLGLFANAWMNVNHLDGNKEWPDIQISFENNSPATDGGAYLAEEFNWNEQMAKDMYGAYNGLDALTISPSIARPWTRGEVTLKSKDPSDPPIVNPNYLEDPRDVQTMVKAIRLIQKFVATKAVQRDVQAHILPDLFTPCAPHGNNTDAYWECFTRYGTSSFRHYAGTCKMAPASDPMAVVDHTLRVHGVSRLRVVDASIMPQIVVGNLMSTVIMIGEKAADMIKQQFTMDK